MEQKQRRVKSHRPTRLLPPNISRGGLRKKTRNQKTREGTWVKVPKKGSFSASGRKAVLFLKLQSTHACVVVEDLVVSRGDCQAGAAGQAASHTTTGT